ncbi:MAG: RNA polymerase sigma factor, partial [Gemmobacter sp.]
MDPAATLARIARDDRGRLLAALIARTGDVAASEEALQEAFAAALTAWAGGRPARPEGWLLRVALRRAIDGWRGTARARAGAAAMAPLMPPEAGEEDAEMIPDERLRLIFTCCHPALERKSQVALTLRLIGGLTTPEIAAAFLDDPATIGQRISRAKAKIGAAGIPYAVPGPELWPERLRAVLEVVYLIFNAGYTEGPVRDLCDEAIFLARLLADLRPAEPEVEGCLALLLLTHARRAARVGADGATVPPGQQDRSRWDMGMMAEGVTLVARALGRADPGPFLTKAAIAALHAAPGGADWWQMLRLYDRLLVLEPTDVVRLNRAVVLAEAGQVVPALDVLDALTGLDGYQPFHAARAFVLGRAGGGGGAPAAPDPAPPPDPPPPPPP